MRKEKLIKVVLTAIMCFVLIFSKGLKTDAAALTTTGIDTEFPMLDLHAASSDGNEVQGENLLVNGDFESGSVGWRNKNDAYVSDWKQEGEPDQGYNQSKYYGVLSLDEADCSLWQEVTLKANTDYVLRAKMLVGKVGGQGILAAKYNSLAGTIAETVVNYDENYDWQYQDVELAFNTGEHTTIEVAVMKWTLDADSDVAKSQVHVDQVELVEATETQTGSASARETYEVVWKEEFDGKSGVVDANGLDLSDWGYELGSIRGVEQQHYTKDNANVQVTDGKLVLAVTDRAQADQYTNPRGTRQVIYNSGSVRTHGKREFLFGRIEVLAKLPSGQATFPAFWTLGADFTLDGNINEVQGDGWPLSGEIDIMESIGDPNVVYQTLHYSDTNKAGYTAGADNGTYAGSGKQTSITTGGQVIDGETYHVFGINWSPGKMEWYIDDQIVRTVDYSNDAAALAALDRPQYIQLNFATGGNWPGDAGSNLAGKTFKIEYVYYAQNAEQKAAASAYYSDTAAINASDVTIVEGTVPDLLKDLTLTPGSGGVDTKEYEIDYSIDNEYMFTTFPDLTDKSTSNDEARTKVECLVKGVSEKEKIADLPAGEYNLHYSAMHEDKPSVRKTVKLTIVEP